MDTKAIAFGNSLRQTLHDASGSNELHVYINYAHGDESLQEVYEYEPWRVSRLKALKGKYDPEDNFPVLCTNRVGLVNKIMSIWFRGPRLPQNLLHF
jgi:hypothetical protein